MIGAPDPALARWLGTSRWILVALANGWMELAALFDVVRSLDGPMGHGTLFAGLARLERQGLIESMWPGTRSVMYRLTTHGRDVAGIDRQGPPGMTLEARGDR